MKYVDNVRIGYICGREFGKYVRVRRGSGNSFSSIGSSDAEKENKNPCEVFSVVNMFAGVTGYGSQQARYGWGHGLASLFLCVAWDFGCILVLSCCCFAYGFVR